MPAIIRNWRISAIGAVLLLAFLVRLPGIPYGLPYHVFGDEEANVYGALKMIELKTVLPVLHQSEFNKLLYYPPLLAYTYAVLFMPILLLKYLSAGMSFADAKSLLTLDPSVLWYIVRTLNVLFALSNIYLTYRIGLSFFRNKTVSWMAALFLATSFIDATVSNAIHHWTPGIFCSLLSLYLVLRAFEGNNLHTKKRLIVWAGITIGCSFSISYLVFFMPFILLRICYREGILQFTSSAPYVVFNFSLIQRTLGSLIRFCIPFTIIAVCIIAVHPGPLFTQIINHTTPEDGAHRTIISFIRYYSSVMWRMETPLVIFGIIGFLAMFKKQKEVLLTFMVFFVTAGILTYAFLFNIARYLLPILPFISLVAGYGLYRVVEMISMSRIRTTGLTLLIILLCVYVVSLFGRYTILSFRNDTRVIAKNWIEAHIPARSSVILNSEWMRLLGTSSSTIIQSRISPGSLRAADRIMLSNDRYAAHPFTLASLFFTSSQEKKMLINTTIEQATSSVFLIYDSWINTPEYMTNLASQGTRMSSWIGGSTALKQISLPIGGERGQASMHIIEQLYRTDYFGPDVYIYVLNSPHTL